MLVTDYVIEAAFDFDTHQHFDFPYVLGFWDGAFSDTENFVVVSHECGTSQDVSKQKCGCLCVSA